MGRNAKAHTLKASYFAKLKSEFHTLHLKNDSFHSGQLRQEDAQAYDNHSFDTLTHIHHKKRTQMLRNKHTCAHMQTHLHTHSRTLNAGSLVPCATGPIRARTAHGHTEATSHAVPTQIAAKLQITADPACVILCSQYQSYPASRSLLSSRCRVYAYAAS
jgi:hypothetical protein